MTIRRRSCIVSRLMVALGLGLGCRSAPPAVEPPQAPVATEAAAPEPGVRAVRTDIRFGSPGRLADHFRKHGAEFEGFTEADYLRAAQVLRDRPVSGEILELARPDRTISRFDRTTGAFVAFDRDGTIRTFFKPGDGEAYFRRQARRRPE